MSHGLLLRLFLSPSFFSVHVALQYLRLYADNIGITYYITRRLRERDIQELRDVWGFICHLLVTRPSKSRALECFVVEIAQRSTHIAMITLWFMQAALKDLALNRTPNPDSPSFAICQRTLHACHQIIFGDLPPPAPAPYAALVRPASRRPVPTRVHPHVEPALVGLGLILAGAPALPLLTCTVGEVALEQGRVEDASSEHIRSVRTRDADPVHSAPVVGNSQQDEGDEDDDDDDDDEKSQDGADNADQQGLIASPEEEHPSRGLQFSLPQSDAGAKAKAGIARRRTIHAAQTSPALPLHLRDATHKPRLSDDPLGQLDPPFPVLPAPTPFQSSPSISTSARYQSGHPLRSNTLPGADDELLQKYDSQAQTHLLRSHYCRSEVQFLLTLENISNRLLVVPRPARVSALRAELTALNHKLPAEVCMPMWCSSSDSPRPSTSVTQPHHRIVRIPPGESVVLNSAERAPYLLLIEILNDDLDFDSARRGNKEVLRKIVAKEEERKGASRELISFATPRHRDRSIPNHLATSPTATNADAPPVIGTTIPPTPTSASTPVPPEEEEIDLVEQLYGAGQSIRARPLNLSESIVLPPPPKNKELDMAAWSRAPLSIPSTPATDLGSPLVPDTPAPTPADEHILSLDEYSERMRTAAVMLAQLNASVVREPITALGGGSASEPPGPLSWLPGASWINSVTFVSISEQPASNSHSGTNDGPVHPSLGGSGAEHAAPVPMRMRVQHAEAAAIRDRIMREMLALEEERMERMRENREGEGMMRIGDVSGGMKTAEDEGIIRRELNKVDPSAVVFSESWATKKSRIRHGSPYGHLANWDCISVIVKTGGDLRQEQLAVQLIQEFERIWQEEKCKCWVRYFRILITGGTSGLVETITDAVSIHSIKKAEYARRLAVGRLGHVTLLDHFTMTYGDIASAKFTRAQRNFAKSLAGYSIVTYLLQIKDRHNGNILLDRDGHLIHIDFGFMLSNSPGNIGFEAAPFKLPTEYIEVLGGIEGAAFLEFKRLFREGFEAARKHCDSIITLVELMQKDSTLPCFTAFGEQTANLLRDRFQPTLTHSLVGEYVDRLIDSSLGSNWTRLYDSYQYYSQSIL